MFTFMGASSVEYSYFLVNKNECHTWMEFEPRSAILKSKNSDQLIWSLLTNTSKVSMEITKHRENHYNIYSVSIRKAENPIPVSKATQEITQHFLENL